MFRNFSFISTFNYSKKLAANNCSIFINKRCYSSSINPKEIESNEEADKTSRVKNHDAKHAAAGSDYFRQIARNNQEDARCIEDLNINSSSTMNIKIDTVENINFRKSLPQPPSTFSSPKKNDPKSFALRFLSKQESMKKYMIEKQKTMKKLAEEQNYDDELTLPLSKNESVLTTTSEPRNFRQEIRAVVKKSFQDSKKFSARYKNKYEKSERELRSHKYTEFRAKQSSSSSSIGGTNPEKMLQPLHSQSNQLLVNDADEEKEIELTEDNSDDDSRLTEEERLERQIKSLRPATRPVVYNLAYFVNENSLLQKFVEMGVVIREWDKDTSIGSFVLKLDFDKHVKPILLFLHDTGIPPKEHAPFITKNPFIFRETIDNLNIRVQYLQSKKFTREQIIEILSKAPKWLSLSVEEVDNKLGWFQKEFKLNGQEVRECVVARPKLVTLPLKVSSDVRFVLKDFLTFDDQHLKLFIKQYPKLFTKNFKQIESNFIFLNQVMKLKHEDILLCPHILIAPLLQLKSRYSYLKHLDRLQFDPTKANFVSLKSIVDANDEQFCKKVAKTTLDEYKQFLKTV